MFGLISQAWAQTAPAAPPPNAGWEGLLFPILLVAIFYFLLIRPQQKRATEVKTMLNSLAKGDEVITTGGLAGRVNALDDNFVALEVASGVEVQIQRQAIAAILPKGTLELKK